MFTPEFYTKNRESLLTALPRRILVVAAGHTQMQLSADLTYPFRQDSNLRYLCGIEEPNVVLVFSKDYSFAIVDDRSEFTSLWDGQDSLEEIKAASGVDEVFGSKDGWKQVRAIMQHHERLGYLEPIDALPWGGTVNPARQLVKKRLKTHAGPQHSLIDIREHMSTLRMTKQPEEIEAIQVASDITALGYENMMKILPESRYEYELQAAFTSAFESQNASHAYDPIIASGPRSCVLHYIDNNKEISDNLILFDVAAQQNGYHSDVSRTVAHKGSFNTRQQAVYDSVLDVQTATIESLSVGMTFVEVDAFMRQKLAEQLVVLGLSKEPSIEDTKKYMPFSSHFIGLDVHDAGDYRAQMQPGSVFTIEPGLCIPEEGIGVRIEDVVHLHDGGADVLTAAIPK